MKKSHIFSLLTFLLFFPVLLSAQCVKGNCTNGKGTFIYPSGAKYIGDFRNGRMHGQGICVYSDKSKYQGAWENGYPQGPGKKTLATGEEWVGQWKKGQPYDRNGNLVNLLNRPASPQQQDARPSAPDQMADKVGAGEGCVQGNCSNGQGTYIYKGHSAKYTGNFK